MTAAYNYKKAIIVLWNRKMRTGSKQNASIMLLRIFKGIKMHWYLVFHNLIARSIKVAL